ncbi:DMT family transporter [Roseicyclus persicicus]|uniref:DMT family transporter n=1 Tax=Roseicyclus persicicus TaxID=2650661 RepID=A0A7X6H3R3_9RHOB|nr:DMT family transporter [Roseibacterium persicicum]NKX46252.1 DMT family transporter [Roseibacterium persicicum]
MTQTATAVPVEAPHQPVRAALWMLGAIVAFSSMAVAGRAASSELDTFEMMTYRSVIGLVVVLAVGAAAGTLDQITRRHMGVHVLRNIFHFTGQNLWFYAVTVAPLALVFALEFTSPLWTMVFAALFLGERLTRWKVLAGLLGFVGVLIVVQPGAQPLSVGMITAAIAAVFFAGTAIFTKRLTRTESITCILFWLTAIQLVIGLVACLWDGDMALPSAAMLPWLLVIGLGGLTAHFCLTTALSIAPASVVMPMDFARLPAIAVVGVLLYAEPLEWAVLLGAVLIFGANYLNILTSRRPG